MFSRRGFLKSLIATAGAAAVFDTKSLTWVPQMLGRLAPVEALTLSDARKGLIISDLEEMQHFAMLCARRLAMKMEDPSWVFRDQKPVIALGSVQYTDQAQGAILRVEGIGRGAFTPHGRSMHSEVAHHLDGQMARKLADNVSLGDPRTGVMLVPITAELRPGEPFDIETLVGVATEPETGVSVRVIRFDNDGMGSSRGRRLGIEVASGQWQTMAEVRQGYFEDRTDRALLRDEF